jgi:hypothetical protein
VLRYHLAALKGDKEQINQVAAPAEGKHGAEHCVAHGEALARGGRLQAARLSIVAPRASIVTKGVGAILLRRLHIHKAITHGFTS